MARAEQLCRDRADRVKLSAVIGTRAGLCFLLGKYPEALEAYKEAYDLALEFENRSGAASSAFRSAQTLDKLRRPQEALDAFRTARELFQIAGEAFWEFQALRHIVDLSEAAAPAGAYGRALEDAVALGLSVGAEAGELIPLHAKLTQLRDRQGRVAEATREFENALDLARKAGNRQLECVLLGNRGAHLADAGRDAEAVTWLEKALRFAVEVGDGVGAEIAATNLDRVYCKETARRLARQEILLPAAVADKSGTALAADPAGAKAPIEEPDEDSAARSRAFDARQNVIQRVVSAFLRQTPEDVEAEIWTERLAKVTAAFVIGEMVGDPAPVIGAVGDDPMLRHLLVEILDCLAFEKIELVPGYGSALETQLATPFNTADCDRAVRDLTTRVERGLRPRDGPLEELSDIVSSDLPRAACHIVAERILADARAAEDATPERALLLSMALCRWLPRHAPSTDKFQAAQLLGGLAQAFRAFDIAAQAWQMAAMSALEGGRRAGFAGRHDQLRYAAAPYGPDTGRPPGLRGGDRRR